MCAPPNGCGGWGFTFDHGPLGRQAGISQQRAAYRLRQPLALVEGKLEGRTAKVFYGAERSVGCEKGKAGLVGVKSDQVRHEMHAGVEGLELDYDEASDE
ncbi:hypothetical protein NDU88_008562 [Pleurodeles waltl]|uniref:Uncharacterized protein n=1 Tax=Pleurodeles waltl TaxID=8319 RepID=A0AAV7PPH6_PLEWA|nr:hypothetical protein NDU88_008562 [Pleurodeles waltl]